MQRRHRFKPDPHQEYVAATPCEFPDRCIDIQRALSAHERLGIRHSRSRQSDGAVIDPHQTRNAR